MSKLVMCGCHVGGKSIVEAILAEGYRFDYFVCLSPEQAQKHNISGYFDFAPMAEAHSIPVYYPKTYSLKAEADVAFFQEQRFDVLVQGGWQRLFPAPVLDTLGVGALGYHGSSDFLPKGRGRSPMNWSIIEDKKRFIMHLFLIKPGADDGDVIDCEDFEITPFDDIETMYFKYSIVNRNMVLRNLTSLLDHTFQVVPQQGKASYYPKRTPEDGKIDWEELDVWQVYNKVRALTRPYPGAFAQIGEEVYTLWKARVFDTRLTYQSAAYGEVVEVFEDKWVINCRGGLLLIDQKELKDEE